MMLASVTSKAMRRRMTDEAEADEAVVDEAEFDWHEYHLPESVDHRRASLWDHSWASESSQSEVN